jgi:hypothetical protein
MDGLDVGIGLRILSIIISGVTSALILVNADSGYLIGYCGAITASAVEAKNKDNSMAMLVILRFIKYLCYKFFRKSFTLKKTVA